MTEPREAFLEPFNSFAGELLRDVWVFDEEGQACLFMRDDVGEALDGHKPERYIDNERYGFITRRTYDDLTYANYQYTVRGFDQFVTFRTFLDGYGILTSVDRGHNHDFAALYDTLCERELDFESLVIGRFDNDSSGSHVTADD